MGAGVLDRPRPSKPKRKSYVSKGAYLYDKSPTTPNLTLHSNKRTSYFTASQTAPPTPATIALSPAIARNSEISAFYEAYVGTPTVQDLDLSLIPLPKRSSYAPQSTGASVASASSKVAVSSRQSTLPPLPVPTTPTRRHPYSNDSLDHHLVPLPSTLVFPQPPSANRTPDRSRTATPRTSTSSDRSQTLYSNDGANCSHDHSDGLLKAQKSFLPSIASRDSYMPSRDALPPFQSMHGILPPEKPFSTLNVSPNVDLESTDRSTRAKRVFNNLHVRYAVLATLAFVVGLCIGLAAARR